MDAPDRPAWPASFWAASAAARPAFPALSGDRRVELAIVGAGYTGLNAALAAAEAGVETAVLEAAQPGWGASGRNGGFACLGGTLFGAAEAHRRFGAAGAAAIHRFQRAAVDRVAANLAEYRIDAAAGPPGELCLAHRPGAMAGLRAEAGFLNRTHGLGVELLDRAALAERGLGPAGFAGGALTPVGFPVDPMAYVAGLARAAAARGVAIHGASPVTDMVHDGGGWLLRCPDGTIRARRAILAANAYAGAATGLADRVLPVPSAILVTRPLTGAEAAAQNWPSRLMAYDSRRLLHYFRRLPDGRFLFGMRGGFGAGPSAARAIRARARRHLAALFPAWRGVDTPYFWSGLVALTARGVPYVGPVSGRPGVVAAFGFHGNGVAMGGAAGRAAAALALDGAARGLPDAFRAPPRRLPPAGLAGAGLGLALRLAALRDGPVRAARA